MAIALVTGASSGLGEEFAWQLATAGHEVVLVGRSRDRLSEVAHNLTGATGMAAELLPADLTTEVGRQAVASRLGDDARPVSLLVNNAGFGLGEGFAATTWEQERALLDIHVTAPAQLTHAALPGMIARGHGAILTVSSIASRLGNSTYAAHKRWQVEFTQALAGQLAGTGVTATAVLPGLVRTHFHDSDALSHMRAEFPDQAWLDPEEVVTAALAAVRRGQTVVTPSARYAVAGALAGLLPTRMTRGRRSQQRD
ncbi:SDR family NAD(P)-dependent oxidoreductase [Demequina sp. SYSU T00039]|uniref:SDR family NAD(P)-dependent oxidoreductase n=1 Tax=Demequina lignilytica TaxID=3051663 RepID=A0AAW7M476_9MICO|nr:MULTISPECIES: SDR family NAD(P)-dependent oxidoreductase [unclassified Demequina]MDN4478752.1 SDR family NAD(P)-dependent oxidoreductase [Demequina sp. SYSU T00039-1]MDN4488729.1 SDR family NAD(P)-dependent oxidoreductase [Demequina sp. SYSU T00039]